MTTPAVFFFVTTDFGALGFGSEGDPSEVFDDAVDQMISAREDKRPATVWRCETTTGQMIDVTDDAMDRAAHFWRCNRVSPPEWAMEAA